jgi:pimeloyl-ACP methyl ester carboxylesterase
MSDVHHRTTTVNGHRIFYREAGPAGAPVVLLLHGFPTSSRMFRRLVPALADRYHVVAPDHLGFGHSATPGADEFTYTFDALTDITQGLLDQLGIARFAMYVQDYGAPIGWRLALRRPAAVTAIISQNGNAYDEGFVPDFWSAVWAYAGAPGPATEPAVRGALALDAIRWQYLTGVQEPDLFDPVPGLRNEPAPLPRCAGVLPHQPGSSARDLGRRRRDLRAGRGDGVRQGPTRGRDPPHRGRPLPARERLRHGKPIHPRVPRPHHGRDHVLTAQLGEQRETGMFAEMSVRNPARRIGTADDIASAVLFALANAFLTGVALAVGGGEVLT